MKPSILILILTVAALATCAAAKDDWPMATGVKGEAYYKRNPAEEWRRVTPGAEFAPGARIKTVGDSWVHIVDHDGQRRCLDANSEIVFNAGKNEGTWKGVTQVRGRTTFLNEDWGKLAIGGEKHYFALCVLETTGQVQYEESTGWLRVRPHFDAYPGHRIKTSAGSTALVRVWDGAVVRLEPNTLVKVPSHPFPERSMLEVQRGKLTDVKPSGG